MSNEEERGKCSIGEIQHDVTKQVWGRSVDFFEADNNQKVLAWKRFKILEGKCHISKHTKGS